MEPAAVDDHRVRSLDCGRDGLMLAERSRLYDHSPTGFRIERDDFELHETLANGMNEGLEIDGIELRPNMDREPVDLQLGSLSVPLDVVDAAEAERIAVKESHPPQPLLNELDIGL